MYSLGSQEHWSFIEELILYFSLQELESVLNFQKHQKAEDEVYNFANRKPKSYDAQAIDRY